MFTSSLSSAQPSMINANDDMSPAERALRDQYCGRLDVKPDAPATSETVIVDPHAFEHVLDHAVKQSPAETSVVAEPENKPASETPTFHLEGVTISEVTKLMEKHKGSRLMLLLPDEQLADAV